jgi:PPM family protein phosphatase
MNPTQVGTLIKAAADSHPGLQRAINEDRFHLDPVRGHFVVIDGVGGQAAGEKAAETALAMVRARLERETGTVEDRVREAIALANNEIFRLASLRAEWQGMACVLTIAVVANGDIVVGHVGDTRLYKLRAGRIEKLTHDHSPVGEREDTRELTETQAMQHARRNEVYRDVGSEWREPDAANFIEIVFTDFAEDSAILLCSDGLSDMVTSLEINRLVRLHAGDPDAAVHALIAAANDAGGKDNITVILAEGRAFAHHTPATPIVFPPPLEPRTSVEGPPVSTTEAAPGAGVELQPAPEPVSARDAAPASRGRGPLSRLLGSRGLALVVGTLLGVSVALLPGYLEQPSGGRRLVVGGPTGEFTSISAALARAESGDVVLVEPGEYAERLDLPAGVELVSRVPDAAVLVAEPSPAPWVSVTAKGGPGALRGFLIQGRANGTIYIGVRLQGDGFEIDDMTFDGAIETAVEIQERAGGSVLHANHFNVSGVPVRLGGAISPMLRRNHFVATADPRTPAIDVGASASPRLDDNLFVRFTQPIAPMRRDLTLQGNVILPPAARR